MVRRLRIAKRLRFERQAGHGLWREDRQQEDIACIQDREHDTRDEGAFIHVADGAPELVGHHDEDERGRNDLRERAGGGDDARRDAAVVAVAQHDGQRDQTHRNDGGRNDAGGRGEQGADEYHGIGDTAADAAKKLPDGFEQVFGHS